MRLNALMSIPTAEAHGPHADGGLAWECHKGLTHHDHEHLWRSGDVDGIVPVLGTRRWIEKLDLPIVRKWRPWYSSTGAALHSVLCCATVWFVNDWACAAALCPDTDIAGAQSPDRGLKRDVACLCI